MREREKERDEMREMDASGQSLFDMPKKTPPSKLGKFNVFYTFKKIGFHLLYHVCVVKAHHYLFFFCGIFYYKTIYCSLSDILCF